MYAFQYISNVNDKYVIYKIIQINLHSFFQSKESQSSSSRARAERTHTRTHAHIGTQSITLRRDVGRGSDREATILIPYQSDSRTNTRTISNTNHNRAIPIPIAMPRTKMETQLERGGEGWRKVWGDETRDAITVNKPRRPI